MNYLSKICAIAVLLMTILGGINAILRYTSKFTGQVWSSNALSEGQWYVFSVVFLLGSVYTFSVDKHVRVDVLYSQFSSKRQSIINFWGHLLCTIPFCVLGIWSSGDFVYNSWVQWEVSSDPGGLARYPIKSLIPIAFFLLLIIAIRSTIQHFRCAWGGSTTATEVE